MHFLISTQPHSKGLGPSRISPQDSQRLVSVIVLVQGTYRSCLCMCVSLCCALLLYNNTAYVNGNFVVCKHFKCQLSGFLTFVIFRSHFAAILVLYQATKFLPHSSINSLTHITHVCMQLLQAQQCVPSPSFRNSFKCGGREGGERK